MSNTNPLTKTVSLLSNNYEMKDCFRFNLFSQDVEYKIKPIWDVYAEIGDPITDETLTKIRYYLGSVCNYEPKKTIVGEACFVMALRDTYHPVKNYIESEKWDGENRLERWLTITTGCDDNLYTQLVGKRFILACVNRVYNPGCKFDHMMILEGDQGIGKSTLVEELASDWYLDTSFENKDKDLVDSMREALIVEVSELAGMTKREVEWVKAFIVRKVDKVRLPYAARTKPFKRNCVFMGTYNPSGDNMYFRDDTGNRRFWPVECKKIDITWLVENKKQLWAEALECYKRKELYYIYEQEAIDIMKNMHAERELESPTMVKIREWLRGQSSNVDMNDIIESALKINTDGKTPKELLSISTTVGIIMKKLGWSKGKNENRHKYYAPDYSEQEVWDE